MHTMTILSLFFNKQLITGMSRVKEYKETNKYHKL